MATSRGYRARPAYKRAVQADEILQEFPRIGSLRLRLLQTLHGPQLDIREYVEADGFTGFTKRGIRLNASELVYLRMYAAQAQGAMPNPPQGAAEGFRYDPVEARGAAPEPVAQVDELEEVEELAEETPEPTQAPEPVQAAPVALSLFDIVDATEAARQAVEEPAKAPTVADLRRRAKAGDVIPLTGPASLAEAVQAEKRPAPAAAPKAPPKRRSLSDLAAQL